MWLWGWWEFSSFQQRDTGSTEGRSNYLSNQAEDLWTVIEGVESMKTRALRHGADPEAAIKESHSKGDATGKTCQESQERDRAVGQAVVSSS